MTRRLGIKARLGAYAILLILVCAFAFQAAPVRWGPQGEIRYTGTDRSGRLSPWNPTCLVWLAKGQQITFSYRARLEASAELRYFVLGTPLVPWRPAVYLGSLTISQSGLGNGIFRAKETGLYFLRQTGPRVWRGEITIHWQVGPR
jgi:hypothetical protein